MATQPPPEMPPQPSQPGQPASPVPEITPPAPDIDVPAPAPDMAAYTAKAGMRSRPTRTSREWRSPRRAGPAADVDSSCGAEVGVSGADDGGAAAVRVACRAAVADDAAGMCRSTSAP